MRKTGQSHIAEKHWLNPEAHFPPWKVLPLGKSLITSSTYFSKDQAPLGCRNCLGKHLSSLSKYLDLYLLIISPNFLVCVYMFMYLFP